MKQQIVVSGIGGQGVLFLTRVIAQAAVDRGLPVLTSESHGMAQRGGTVLSTLKIGDFAAPLIRTGQADVALLLHEDNIAVHRPFLKKQGIMIVNADKDGEGQRIDGTGIARNLGQAVLANLVVLGRAVSQDALFCSEDECLKAIRKLAPEKYAEQNFLAFKAGIQH